MGFPTFLAFFSSARMVVPSRCLPFSQGKDAKIFGAEPRNSSDAMAAITNVVTNTKYGEEINTVGNCYGLGTKCPPQVHVWNTWSSVGGPIWGGSGNFRK
jgi:hypothetical protein